MFDTRMVSKALPLVVRYEGMIELLRDGLTRRRKPPGLWVLSESGLIWTGLGIGASGGSVILTGAVQCRFYSDGTIYSREPSQRWTC